MTPKEKAKELVDTFRPYMYPFGAGSAYLAGDTTGNNVLKDAKECATICTEQVLRTAFLEDGKMITEQEGFVSFWQQVIKEISKL